MTDLSRRLNRASMGRLAVGVLLAVSVLVAGLTQPDPSPPAEVQVPRTQQVTLSG
jgi:hypothetical protein